MNYSAITIEEAHRMLVSKECSAVDLVTASLERIRVLDNTLHAFLTVCEEEALAGARVIDKKIASGQSIRLLEGIPFSAKDVMMTAGCRTTAGSNMLKNFVAPFDATAIARLQNAGAILIGKTNCDAYGHGSSTENSDFGETKNPWDTTRVAGGSSGGSAVAVATGMGLFSVGEDTGGSIRQPAALCGVTGLKVSYGRVSRYGAIAYASSLDTIGPFTKTAKDAAIVLKVMAGHDQSDSTSLPGEAPDYHALIEQAPQEMSIGIPAEYFSSDLDPAIQSVIMEAIAVLEAQNFQVKEISLPHTSASVSAYYLIAASETSSNLARLDGIRFGHSANPTLSLEEYYQTARSEGFGPEAQRRIIMGTYALSAGYHEEWYAKAQKVRTLICGDFDVAFEKVDAIISPTSPFTAFPIGQKSNNPLDMYLADIYTTAFSLAGLPTISVPCGFSDGLPVGMQITAPHGDDARVLQLAHIYQQLTDWHLYHPSL